MTSITLHDLDDAVAARLRARAAKHGRTVEQEACAVLRDALGVEAREPLQGNAATAFREYFREYWAEFGDVELPIPPRQPAPDPPTFD